MKIGSLVICPNGHESYDCRFVIPASNDIIYEVMDIKIIRPNEVGIQILEKGRYVEIYFDYETELWYHIEAFREVQPPMDLTELVQESNQLKYDLVGRNNEQNCLNLITEK